jgi:hypothetical protein
VNTDPELLGDGMIPSASGESSEYFSWSFLDGA